MRFAFLLLTPIFSQTIPLTIPEGPETLLSTHFTPEIYTVLSQHGCFCSKMFDITANYYDHILRGGNLAVDDLDDLCQKWLRTRECEILSFLLFGRNFVGGSCYKTMIYNAFYESSDCQLLANECDKSTCLIDEFYPGWEDVFFDYRFCYLG